MSSWHLGPMLALDTETTGPNPNTARIVTAFARQLGWGADQPFEWLADPGVEIPAGATAVHGITTERARAEGRQAGPVVYEIAELLAAAADLGVPVIGHNVAYDLTVVDRECRRHDIDPPPWDRMLVVDTMVLDKHVWRYRRGSRKLVDVAVTYGVPIKGDAHDASADAMASARIGYRIAQIGCTPFEDRPAPWREVRYGKPAQAFEDAACPADELHHWLRIWASEQAESLEAYFRKTDPTAVVDREWPVRPVPAGWDPAAVDPVEVPA